MNIIPNLFNPRWWRKSWQEVKLAWMLLRDPGVSRLYKLIPVIVLIYILSPFDLIPGFLPIIGQLDDAGLLLLGVKLFTRMAPDEVVQPYAQALNIPYMVK